MACVAEQSVACECSSKKLASAPGESGRVLLCTQCARAYIAPHKPITWSRLELELGRRTADLYAFGWIRSGVPVSERRTLSELTRSGGRFRSAERSGAALGMMFAVVLLLVACRAVLS